MTILLTRSQVDEVLKTYCDQIGLSCSDLHDDAFVSKTLKAIGRTFGIMEMKISHPI